MPPLTPLPPTSIPNPWLGAGRGSCAVMAAPGDGVAVSATNIVLRHRMCCDGTVINTALPAGQDVATLRRVAEALAAEAAEFVRTRRAEVFVTAPVADAVAAKSDPTDPVTIVDTETEALLRARLAELRPGDAILGEEGGGPAQAAAPGAVTCAGSDRRHGELRLRHPGVRGIGGRAGRRGLGGGRGGARVDR